MPKTAALYALLAGLVLLTTAPAQGDGFDFAARKQHWAWQPLQTKVPPAVRAANWPQDPLDAFVLRELEQRGLAPAADAAPAAWLRRVYLDLLGLPPTPNELAAFLADPSPAARARIVDDLLARTAFGERWARHWLDLVRYAESLGHEFDFPIPNAWRYRDYVIRALNRDVPFDQFGKEHIAGDLLPEPRIDPRTLQNESVQGTAFWWFPEQTHSPVDAKLHQANRIDNQVDVLSKAFLGMTVACARCHDHKFDAIRSSDYYSFFGFVKSSRYVQQPVFATPAELAQSAERAQRELAELATLPAEQATEAPLRDGDTLLANLTQAPWTGMRRIGDGFGAGPWRGPFVRAYGEQTVQVHQLPGEWAVSAALAPDRQGVLLSPDFTIDRKFLHIEVAGEHARILVVYDGFNLARDPLYGEFHRGVGNPSPHWITIPLATRQGGRAHVQCIDQRAQDLADPDHERSEYPAQGWIAVRRMVLSNEEAPPPLVQGKTCSATLARSDAQVGKAATRWLDLVTQLPPADTLPGMADGSGEDEYVYLRGDHKKRGPVARRRFLEALAGDGPMDLPCGSGRLQLAESIFAADDPLPARVFVNRIWHHLFGRGLVRSVDNLGNLGDRPTHQDLLDYLAASARDDGWSWKRTIRRIVLSRTYGMASDESDEQARRIDPDNVWLHRQNLRRLEGEALRDCLLAFADRLDTTSYGPPVPVPLDADDKARGKPEVAGPVDGRGRRSIYLAVPRNFLHDFLLAFDTPIPFATVGARNVSNVPGQALALLNDPFVLSMSRLAAEHALAEGLTDDRAVLDRLFRAAFARSPSSDESAECRSFVDALTADGSERIDAWAELAHVLVNKKEFLFIP